MRVFFVRHGQSAARTVGLRQSPDSPLSELGKKEAASLGQRIKRWGISFDRVFSSKLPRAKETAEIITKILGANLEIFEGIQEREQHPGLYGADLNSKIHKENVRQYNKNAKNLDYKFRGQGESLREVIVRAIKFKKHLETKHQGQDILIISHGLFIRIFITVCILGENYDDASFTDVYGSLNIHNTGVSLLRFEEKNKAWGVVYINNFSHLKDVRI
jgi:broad specificity phosphatase PhoE